MSLIKNKCLTLQYRLPAVSLLIYNSDSTTAMKVLRILLLAPIIVFFFAACQPNEKRYLVGVSQCSSDTWRDKLNTELRIGSYYYNNLDVTIVSAHDNDQKQIEQIDSLVKAGVDLLVVSPNQISTISDAIDRAYDQGIPVILFDRKSDSPKYTAYMGADNYEIGRTMGSYIANKLKGRGNVVEIMGLKGSSPAIERHKGFVDALKKYPNIQLLESRSADWTTNSSRTQMDKLMAHYSSIDVVFAHNDRMALGAREAWIAKGRTDSTLFVGVDALPTPRDGIDAVRERRLAASCLYPTRGDRVIELAMNILEGRPYERNNKLRAALVTQENATLLHMQAEEVKRQYARLENIHDKVDEYLTRYQLQTLYIILLVVVIILILSVFVWLFRYFSLKHRLAEDAAKAKLQFFTNVSHEFRTPLTLISDPIERLLEDNSLSSQQNGLLKVAQKNTRVLLRLVNEILDLRKAQSGNMTTKVSAFDLRLHLQQWVDSFQNITQQRSVTLTLSAPDHLPFVGDLHKIELICYNLLSNAVKFTPKSGEVKVEASLQDKGISISVSDTGKGIEKGDIPHIFERFFQSNNNNQGGTGIGLAVVKAFVEVHGGTIKIESEVGKGTTFQVYLPQLALDKMEQSTKDEKSQQTIAPNEEVSDYLTAPSPSSTQTQVKQQLTNLENEQTQAHVLIVDDHEAIRDYVSQLLTDAHYKVLTAADGEGGWQQALRQVPDLVICDVSMPILGGLELCRRLKTNEITSHIPVVLLTANAQDAQRAEGYENGADAYITKPFSGKVLLSRIENLLHNRRVLRDLFSNNSEPTSDATPDADSLFIEHFKAKVKEQLSNTELNVEDLSADLGMSRVQLYRKVKALTGTSPVELIRITRLKRAEILLMQGGKTIAEVAYEVGFSSPSYFSKCFKDYFGCLPGSKIRP